MRTTRTLYDKYAVIPWNNESRYHESNAIGWYKNSHAAEAFARKNPQFNAVVRYFRPGEVVASNPPVKKRAVYFSAELQRF